MLSNIQIVERAAADLGMQFDKKQSAAVGQFGGFTMLVKSSASNSRENCIILLLCASKDGQGADMSLIAERGIPSGVYYMAEGAMHLFKVQVTMRSEEVLQTIKDLARMAASVLSEAGYVNCSNKGEEGSTEVYIVKGQFLFLTPDDAAGVASELSMAKLEYDEVPENRLMGIIGAVIGSLAGAAVILLCGRLGFISMLGGLAMGAATVLLYKKLGHKLSGWGAVFSTILAVVMSFLAFKTDSALDVLMTFKGTELESEISFLDCFLYARDVYELADALFEYYCNMALILISGAGSSAAVIWGDRMTTKQSFDMIKIGEE